MTPNPPRNGELPSVERLSARIRACCLKRGWDEATLAQKAGISRTTLYHLHRGNITRPRVATLHRLADALELSLQDFLWGSVTPTPDPTPSRSSQFDRDTNSLVRDVIAAHPAFYHDWTERDWEELYSTFGVGGALNEHGILAETEKINQSRRTRHRLNVVLDTHLRDVAIQFVETLYRMIVPEGNLAPTADLESLLNQHLESEHENP